MAPISTSRAVMASSSQLMLHIMPDLQEPVRQTTFNARPESGGHGLARSIAIASAIAIVNQILMGRHNDDYARLPRNSAFGNRKISRNPGSLSSISTVMRCSSATAATKLRPSPLPGVARLESSR